MNFTYYSDKTVSQCMMALNERLHSKNGKLDGWTEKNGNFSLACDTTVMRRFSRTTRLQAKAERDNNLTVIKGNVPNGIDPQRRMIIFAMLVVAGFLIILSGSLLPGVIAILAPALLNIPLEGDYKNSQILVSEVQRALKAKENPPAYAVKKSDEARRTTTVARKPAVTHNATSAKKTSSQQAKAHR